MHAIDGGTMTVARDGDKHTLTIDFIDCDKEHPNHVRTTYSQDAPITYLIIVRSKHG